MISRFMRSVSSNELNDTLSTSNTARICRPGHEPALRFRNWTHALYVREARRMIGRYVMRQQDCQEENTKPDAIAMGGFILDSHAYQRLVTPEGYVIDEGNFDVAPSSRIRFPTGASRRPRSTAQSAGAGLSFGHARGLRGSAWSRNT